MTYRYSSPICLWCKHLDPSFLIEHKYPNAPKRRCAAFPEEIPDFIWELRYDHREPHPDDNGIRFEQQLDTSKLPRRIFEGLLTSDEELKLMFQLLTDRRKHGTARPLLETEPEEEPTITFHELREQLVRNAFRRRRREARRRQFNAIMKFLGLRKDTD